MKPTTTPKKWTKAQRITVGVLAAIILMLIGIINSSDENSVPKKPEMTQAQKDSANKAELIKKSFSAWDGSHINLVTLLKNNLNDAKSFEHIDTRYREISDSTLFVSMDYRAANMFGGLVKKRITAIVTLDGQILKVEE